MPVLKYPLGIIALFFATGIFLQSTYDVGFTALISCFAVAFIALILSFRQASKSLITKPYFTISTVLVSIIAGMLTQWLHYAPNQKLHYSNFINSNETAIEGYVSERLKPNDYTERYYFEVTAINGRTASGRILLTAKKDSLKSSFIPGSKLIIADSPTAIGKPLNPFQFDYAAYMEKQGVFHQIRLKDNYAAIGTVYNFDYYLGQLRHSLTHSFAIHNYSPQVQATLNALLLGQRQDMDPEVNNAYKDAGVLHILAISGLHFAVLFYVLMYIFKPLNRLQQRGKLIRLIAIITLLWSFAFITGLSASVVRSVVMFTIICIGQYINRQNSIYNSLIISMLVMLIAQPSFLFDAGFQLSYLAVFAIIWFEPFYRKYRSFKYKAINYINDTLLVSVAAQIGVLPLSLYYFGRFPLLFLIANLIVIPLSSIVLLLGLFVLLLNFISTDIAIILGKALGWLTEAMNTFIAWIASFENLIVKDIPFTQLLTVLLYAVLALLGLWIYKKDFKRTASLLVAVLLFQTAYMITAWQAKNTSEFIIFHNYENSLLALKQKEQLTVLSNDSLKPEDYALSTYSRGRFNPVMKQEQLPDIIWHNGKRILVIDEAAIISLSLKPDILLLSCSPKINLEKVIAVLNPKEIIADGTNYNSHIKRWKGTCKKLKIPFHATAEKGFYKLSD